MLSYYLIVAEELRYGYVPILLQSVQELNDCHVYISIVHVGARSLIEVGIAFEELGHWHIILLVHEVCDNAVTTAWAAARLQELSHGHIVPLITV